MEAARKLAEAREQVRVLVWVRRGRREFYRGGK